MRLLVLFVALIFISFESMSRDTLVTIKIQGKTLKKEISEAKLSIFLFFSTECPLCSNYATYLNDLYRNYQKDGVKFTYIFGASFTEREVKDFVERFDLKGKSVRDSRGKYMRAFQATTTPEVFVLDKKSQLEYSGAIDNRAYEIGKLRKVITEEYLKSVIQSSVNNDLIPYRRVSPIGCLLEQ